MSCSIILTRIAMISSKVGSTTYPQIHHLSTFIIFTHWYRCFWDLKFFTLPSTISTKSFDIIFYLPKIQEYLYGKFVFLIKSTTTPFEPQMNTKELNSCHKSQTFHITKENKVYRRWKFLRKKIIFIFSAHCEMKQIQWFKTLART